MRCFPLLFDHNNWKNQLSDQINDELVLSVKWECVDARGLAAGRPAAETEWCELGEKRSESAAFFRRLFQILPRHPRPPPPAAPRTAAHRHGPRPRTEDRRGTGSPSAALAFELGASAAVA